MEEFMIRLQARLDQLKSVSNINSDIKRIQGQLKQIKIKAKTDPNTAQVLAREIEDILNREISVSNIGIDTDNITRTAQQAGQAIGQAIADSAQDAVNDNSIDTDRLRADEQTLTNDPNAVKDIDAAQSRLSRLGGMLKDQFKEAGDSLKQMLSVSSGISLIISKTQESISDLKEVNTLLTEISKANDRLSKSELAQIGNDSFKIAGKYGSTAADYLAAVREASIAGYENAAEIAELSIAIQGAGDMTAELANQYILATDKAYSLGGSVGKLTEVLDGCNYIADHNTINMADLAEGMSIVGSQAASLGIKASEATAVLGTMIASTQQSGSEMAQAFNVILLYLRQIADEEEGIDAESLIKYEEACNALNVSLKETKNGITSLRDPMEVLKDLAAEYSKLDSSDMRRTDLLSSVGGKLNAEALDAILGNYDTYSKMLDEYARGTGSMAAEAEKTASSWEGSLNRLSSTWTDIVGNIADSDGIIAGINALNSLLSVVNNVTDTLGSLGTIGLGAGLFAGLKNVGRPRMSGLVFC